MFIPSLLSRAREAITEARGIRETVKILSPGVNRRGEDEFLSFDSMRSSFLVGKEEETKLRFLQLLLEECVINGIQPIIFDYGRHFRGLTKPNPEPSRKVEPIGFTSDFLGTSYVDLSLLPVEVLAEVFGLGTDFVSKKVVEKMKETRDMQRAYDRLGREKRDYDLAKASRILKLLMAYYGDKVGSSLHPDAFLPKEKAKAIVLELGNMSDEVRMGIIASVISAVLPKISETNPVRPFFIILKSDSILAGNSALSEEFDILFEECLKKPVFIMLSTDSDEFISDKIFNLSESKIYVSDRNEIVIKQSHTPPLRVRLRPLHSLFEK
jgi:hypothetical protein